MSQDPLDTSDKGYQPPLDESLVKEFDPEDAARAVIRSACEDMMRGRGRGGGSTGGPKGCLVKPLKGRGKGKGRGRGKGKGRGKVGG